MQKFKFLSKDKKKLIAKQNDIDSASTSSETRLISRNALICSSGKVSGGFSLKTSQQLMFLF